jgi:hypothetical protein
VPAKSSGLIVSLPSSAGPAPDVSLVLGGPHGRRVVGKRFRPGQGVIISTLFRSAKERRNVVLIVTSGTKKGARYSIQFAALRAGQKIPQWIAWIPLAARPG